MDYEEIAKLSPVQRVKPLIGAFYPLLGLVAVMGVIAWVGTGR
jgi:hypothetical protein